MQKNDNGIIIGILQEFAEVIIIFGWKFSQFRENHQKIILFREIILNAKLQQRLIISIFYQENGVSCDFDIMFLFELFLRFLILEIKFQKSEFFFGKVLFQLRNSQKRSFQIFAKTLFVIIQIHHKNNFLSLFYAFFI